MKQRSVLITNDVETTSIINHCLSDDTGKLVLEQGMPRLLSLYDKYNVKATFFFTGYIAKLYPEVVKMVLKYGHEVGSHGLTHESDSAFDVLDLTTQKEHLSTSKNILEDITGSEVISFRAPAARVSRDIVIALSETGYKIDSSVSSQRIDMFLSFGSLKKLHWLTTPRKPYFASNNSIFKKGNSDILEIPISAAGFPYIGTFMRISPTLNRFTRNILHIETKATGRPFNFLTHPNEFIDEKMKTEKIQRRGNNIISYWLGDVLRHKLKSKNLGKKAIPIFEKELKFFEKNSYEFITCKELYKRKITKNAG